MSKRILIIDDDEPIRESLKLGLEAEGYEVETAAGGSEGLERFGSGNGWGLVLLDQRMPGMNGLEVLHRLRATRRSVPVMLLSGHLSMELTGKSLHCGARGFLTKPISLRSLREVVRQVFRPLG